MDNNARADELGLTYSCRDEDSIRRFNLSLDAYLASRSDVMPMLEDLLAHDEDMPMALCFRGYLLKLASDARFVAPIRDILAKLEEQNTLNDREQKHVDILRAWSRNLTDEALKRAESLLRDYPKDILALRVAHYLHFYAGAAADMRDSVSRSLAVWKPNEPFYGYLLGMQSFGLEEAGDYEAAERTGKQAVDINGEDIWAAHAVTHVFQMQERYREGIPWIDHLRANWARSNNFVYHLYWHKALLYLGLGQPESALQLYDDLLEAPIADDFYLDVCNAASLLWRLEMAGIDVGDRWHALHDISARRVTDNELLFASLHYLMTPAVLRDHDTIRKAVTRFDEWSEEPTTQGEICRLIGRPLATALIDIGLGEHAKAADTLAAVRDDIYLIGGSHAQRHLFDELMHFAAQTSK